MTCLWSGMALRSGPGIFQPLCCPLDSYIFYIYFNFMPALSIEQHSLLVLTVASSPFSTLIAYHSRVPLSRCPPSISTRWVHLLESRGPAQPLAGPALVGSAFICRPWFTTSQPGRDSELFISKRLAFTLGAFLGLA